MTRTEISRKKRQEQLRFRITVFIIGFLFCIIIFFLLNSIVSNADKRQDNDIKVFTSIQIQYGETLWSIADDYMDEHYHSQREYIKEVVNINSLSNEDEIKVGQYIIVPYYTEDKMNVCINN